MAPNLAASQHDLIRDMISARTLTTAQMAAVAGCSERSIKAIRSNLRYYNSTRAPAIGGGRRQSISPPMLGALCDHLLEKPGLYQEGMFVFLWDEFEVRMSPHSISRALKDIGWPEKAARQIAKEQNADLLDFYLYNLTQFQSYLPSVWLDVYNLLRCPDPPCSLGPHCWRDPHGKTYYKLRAHQLKTLIRHVAQEGQLLSHDDVPEDILQQLYAEEQQQLERHQRSGHSVLANHASIHITNVLPGPSHPTLGLTEMQAKPRLDVPGFLDAAVEEYSDWQQSRVRRDDQKHDIRNMCDMALEHGLDLQQLHDDQDPDFFISQGIKIGVARRFIRDIEHWVQQQVAATGLITID